MVFAVVLVLSADAVNFQSWLDPFIILTALPGAMAGILWMLFVTGNDAECTSLDGSVDVYRGCHAPTVLLMVTFANDERTRYPG